MGEHGTRRLGQAVGVVLRPPHCGVERVRWLFLLLALMSLVLILPVVLGDLARATLSSGLAIAAVLAWSWIDGYRRRGVSAVQDVVDPVAVTLLLAIASTPTAVFSIVFPVLWYRSQYGSTWRAIARCVLLAATFVAAPGVWSLVPGHSAVPPPADSAAALPVMILAVGIARYLGGIALRADHAAALAALGPRLVGVLDAATIRRDAWRTIHEVCTISPALRVLEVRPRDGELRVVAAAGDLPRVPESLPGSVVSSINGDPPSREVSDAAAIEAATGAADHWTCVCTPSAGDDEWTFLVGGPRRVIGWGVTSVRSVVDLATLALENSLAHEQLAVRARTDALTGLLNRPAFTDALVTALAAQRATPVSVLFVDLNDFKVINDRLGHRVGDWVLRETATRLREVTRPQDACARLGGDEFAVLITGAEAQSAAAIAQRASAALSRPLWIGDQVCPIKASVGHATAMPGTGAEELLHQADLAMYAEKARLRGRTADVPVGGTSRQRLEAGA
jgi:diguanylate cyclase (GGDEF)-like protein